MKKNTMMRIASVLLIAVLITTCAISGTFAKYTSTVSGSSTTKVAKWAFTADDVAIDLAEDKTFTFDVFATVNDTLDGNDEGDVADDRIAPGTKGFAAVEIENASEVNATYLATFTANEAGVPLQWSTNGTDWENDITQLNMAEAAAINMNGSATITIHWQWAIGEASADAADTALGIAGSAEPTFTATVTITQKD